MKRVISKITSEVSVFALLAGLLAIPAFAADITITNPSFESGSTGWTLSGAGSTIQPVVATGMPTTGPDGSANGLFLQNEATVGPEYCRQILSAAVLPNTTYTLTVDIGNWLGVGQPPKFQLLNEDSTPLGGDVTAGDGVAADAWPVAGAWGTWVVNWTTGPSVGTHYLRIYISTINETPSGTFVDNLRLAATPAGDLTVVNHSFEDTPLGTGWTFSPGNGSSVRPVVATGMPTTGPDGSANGLFFQNQLT